jgi:tetratricopeptide (TPR) repeat protein
MALFPQDPGKIRARIRSYERKLKKEQEEFGLISDGYGKRYLLGSLYMLLGDEEGALKHYAWFEETFPDDSGDPMHLLCWTLALYRSGDLDAAAGKLRRLMLSNLYIIPHLLGIEQAELDIWHGTNLAYKAHLEDIPSELFAPWDEAALHWLRATYHSPEISQIREQYITIQRQLKTEPRGPKRSQLVDEAFALKHKS